MSAEIFLEIGTEEIPSDYLENGLTELKDLAEACLKENRIMMTGEFSVYGTPRRLILIGKGLADKQKDMVQEITGPPKKAAYDKDGNPTKAAEGFAKKFGVSTGDLQTIETDKGEYLYVRREITGRSTKDVMAESLPG
ncbi:MAG: glycine--tRNA ligase subunit beta, partial [Deltaproteobacteria bacterium]|nr:glycine--tRNA ligase subunit beta [Deltaproteobacteria bacterium]